MLERITTGAPVREVLDLLVNTIEARADGMLGSVLLLGIWDAGRVVRV